MASKFVILKLKENKKFYSENFKAKYFDFNYFPSLFTIFTAPVCDLTLDKNHSFKLF